MMANALTRPTALIDRLPPVRGSLAANAPLHRFTWFRVGGPAAVLFRPADTDDLAAFLAELPSDVPVTVIGVASNLIIRDGGIDGVVIKLDQPAFREIAIDGSALHAGGGALDIQIARAARDAGLSGLEFLVGIPGTIGGAVPTNAGAYGRELGDVLVSIEAVDRDGKRHTIPVGGLGLAYRHSQLPAGWIVTRASLRAAPGDPSAITARMEEIQRSRADTQPVRERTGGSTFANPPGHKAWQLIDQSGCRGLQQGEAQVSEKHCNFLINLGHASAADLEGLGESVRDRVRAATGIDLRWEIRRIGRPAEDEA